MHSIYSQNEPLLYNNISKATMLFKIADNIQCLIFYYYLDTSRCENNIWYNYTDRGQIVPWKPFAHQTSKPADFQLYALLHAYIQELNNNLRDRTF